MKPEIQWRPKPRKPSLVPKALPSDEPPGGGVAFVSIPHPGLNGDMTGPAGTPMEHEVSDSGLPDMAKLQRIMEQNRERQFRHRQREKTKKCKTCDGSGIVAGGERGEVMEVCDVCLILRAKAKEGK